MLEPLNIDTNTPAFADKSEGGREGWVPGAGRPGGSPWRVSRVGARGGVGRPGWVARDGVGRPAGVVRPIGSAWAGLKIQ